MDTRQVANYLLNHCFLMGSCEETQDKYYYALKYIDELRALFQPLGYKVAVHQAPLKTIALVNEYEGNQVRLKKYESILLLICRLLYLKKREKLAVDGDRVVVTIAEIQEEYQKLNLPLRLDQRNAESAFRTLRNYNLARPLETLNHVGAQIEVFPSVILALPDDVLKASQEKTAEYMSKYEISSEEEEE